MGHVPHGPEHDDDDAPGGQAEALTRGLLIRLLAFNVAALLIVASLCALCAWQIQRRAWKHDLIERVERGVHSPPTAAPGRESWPGISGASDEYRRVSVTGRWLPIQAAFVQASTVLGTGYWVMSPFGRDDGTTIFINRGFVPPEARTGPDKLQPTGANAVTMTGLLRLSMPKGAFLRTNDPAVDRWYSRDIAAIAASRGIEDAAPFFIDADRTDEAGGPVGGLTVVSFANNHLVYAITWGTLAIMAAAFAGFVNLDLYRRSGQSP